MIDKLKELLGLSKPKTESPQSNLPKGWSVVDHGSGKKIVLDDKGNFVKFETNQS